MRLYKQDGTHSDEDFIIPAFGYKVQVLSGHPPLKKEKEQAIDDQNYGIDGSRERAQLHGSNQE